MTVLGHWAGAVGTAVAPGSVAIGAETAGPRSDSWAAYCLAAKAALRMSQAVVFLAQSPTSANPARRGLSVA